MGIPKQVYELATLKKFKKNVFMLIENYNPIFPYLNNIWLLIFN